MTQDLLLLSFTLILALENELQHVNLLGQRG